MKQPTVQPPGRTFWGRLTLLTLTAANTAPLRAGAPSIPLGTPTDPGSLFSEALFLRLGFSFIVGLATGFALKLAFKLALVVIGIILIGLFTLQYAGLAEVDWFNLGLRYDAGADWLGTQAGPLLDFMGRNLPSAASFLAGLALGLKL